MRMAVETGAPGLRCVTSEVGLLSQPDGSASFNQGDTCALVAVYGPAEVKMHRERIDRATIDVLYKPKVGLPGCADKLLEGVVSSTCDVMTRAHLHPRSLLSVVIQQVHDAGAFLATCLNATCLALLDACYPMHFTIAAVTCVVTCDKELILDPNLKQETNASSYFMFVFESREKSVVACHTKGAFTVDDYNRALKLCRDASDKIFEFYKETLKKKMLKSDG